MKPADLRTALARLDLTQVAAARLLRANPRSMRKWLAGDRAVPACEAILIRLILAGKITISDVERA